MLIINKILRFFYYQRVVLYGYDLSRVHAFEAEIGYPLSAATLADVERTYLDDLNRDLTSIDLSLWREKISTGHWKGFVCKDGERVIAQAFYSTEDVFFGGTKWVVLSMPKESGYGFKLYTRPDYRGKKIGQAITSYRLNNAKKEGLRRFYTIINSGNTVSRHNEEKIGGYLVGSVIFLKCRFFNIVMVSPFVLKEGFRRKEIRDFIPRP